MIAADLCGRQARLLEFDPIYCDTIIRRWQQYTGKQAVLVESGASFEAAGENRVGAMRPPIIPTPPAANKRRRSNG